MNDQEQTDLRTLLTTFDATSLGQGDPDAGANLLATMVVTLANISPPGCGIVSPKLGRIRAGASLLVSGGFSSSLVADNVVAEVAIRQNNLTAQLRRLIGDKAAGSRSTKPALVEFPAGPKANHSENALFQLEQRDSLASLEAPERWAEVVGSPPPPRIDDLAARPKVLVTSTGAGGLPGQLHGLHLGRPLVAVGLKRAADVMVLGDTCGALLDGLLPDGLGGETAAGNLLLTDPAGVLRQVVENPSDDSAWIGRLLWLVDGDGDADPGLRLQLEGGGAAPSTNMTGRFGAALSGAFGARLNNHDTGTIVHSVDLDAAQIRWVAFLKETEPRLPGISGAARRLLATLAFGLVELGHGGGEASCLRVSVAQIEAFARFLILRMAGARTSMAASAQQWRRQQFIRRIFLKLSAGQMNKRDLYRQLSIDAGFCTDLLLEMEAEGLVRSGRHGWERIAGATLQPASNCQLTLEA